MIIEQIEIHFVGYYFKVSRRWAVLAATFSDNIKFLQSENIRFHNSQVRHKIMLLKYNSVDEVDIWDVKTVNILSNCICRFSIFLKCCHKPILMVPTWTGKPWEKISVREKSGKFEQTGKVGNFSQFLFLFFYNVLFN